ncbi:hypothetical protein MASR2M15_00320 [Anaerolineales bacterium]
MTIQTYTIRFSQGSQAPAIGISPDGDAGLAIRSLKLKHPRPVIFITGGAAKMNKSDIQATRHLIAKGIAPFAQKHQITVISGGTEAGIMQMMGDARMDGHYTFPLIGVSPLGCVKFPGKPGSGDEEAELNDGHSHFVLVKGDEWGMESRMIVELTRKISHSGKKPMLGILINGGQVAMNDVYLATAKGKHSIPMLVIAGSGRTADEVAKAYTTQIAPNPILKAIIAGGNIKVVELKDGLEAFGQKLKEAFQS